MTTTELQASDWRNTYKMVRGLLHLNIPSLGHVCNSCGIPCILTCLMKDPDERTIMLVLDT